VCLGRAGSSEHGHEKFGEEVTNELVNWFNAVDTTYRGELRELNESNFARFDAKLEQRLTALRSDLDMKWTERWTALEAKMGEGLAELRSLLSSASERCSSGADGGPGAPHH
jgi:hypothetical protein